MQKNPLYDSHVTSICHDLISISAVADFSKELENNTDLNDFFKLTEKKLKRCRIYSIYSKLLRGESFTQESIENELKNLSEFTEKEVLIILYLFVDTMNINTITKCLERTRNLVVPSERDESADLTKHLRRFAMKELALYDHKYYPIEIKEISRKKIKTNNEINFSLYFGISYAHVVEIINAVIVKLSLPKKAIKINVFRLKSRYSNNFILDILGDLGLIKLIELESGKFKIKDIVKCSLSYEVKAISKTRELAQIAGIPTEYNKLNKKHLELDHSAQLLRKKILKYLAGNRNISEKKTTRNRILFHVRTQAYKKQEFFEYRDSSYSKLEKILRSNYIANSYPDATSNYKIRKDDCSRDEQTELSKQCCQLLSIYTHERFIGTTSGPGHFTPSLGIPTLLLNSTTLAGASIGASKCLLSLKKIQLIDKNIGHLTKEKKLRIVLNFWLPYIMNKVIIVRELNEEEILQEISEFEKFNRYLDNGKEWKFSIYDLILSKNISNLHVGQINITEATYNMLSTFIG